MGVKFGLTLREERKLMVFENRVLRGIFGSKRDEVTREWRKLHSEVFNDLYYSPNIVLLVWGRGEVCTRFRWGNLRERDHLEGPDVDGKISKRIFSKWDGGTDWIDLAQ
jgi:hypothetical protein